MPSPDMMTLARLHAALDYVVESEQVIAGIREASRARELLVETRELLRRLLTRQENRQPVGFVDTWRDGR